MPDIKKDPTSSQPPSKEPRSEDSALSDRLEKEADEMAEEGQRVEKRYDQDHDIFTK